MQEQRLEVLRFQDRVLVLTGVQHKGLRADTRYCEIAGGGSIMFCLLGSARLGSVRFGSVRFGSVRFGTVRCGSVQIGSMCFIRCRAFRGFPPNNNSNKPNVGSPSLPTVCGPWAWAYVLLVSRAVPPLLCACLFFQLFVVLAEEYLPLPYLVLRSVSPLPVLLLLSGGAAFKQGLLRVYGGWLRGGTADG